MFRFKQFTVHQDRTAMKVCTDACILGAYAELGSGGRILDIGAGTGLLALMAAQRSPAARIDAVEIDESAYGQAVDNCAASPFADRISVHLGAIQQYARSSAATPASVDRILSNPPFYTRHLRSPDAAVNRALHNDELPFEELITSVVRLLKQDGQFWVLLPPFEMERLSRSAINSGLRPFRRLRIRHHARKPVFREISGFAYQETSQVREEELFIYETDGRTYTEPFHRLLQPFYLFF